MQVPVSWACPTDWVPATTYTVDRWRAYGGRWVDCTAAAHQTHGWVAARRTTAVASAHQAYAIPSAATAIRINYHIDSDDGHREAAGGVPAAGVLTVALNGQATGPAAVRIEVFANFPAAGPVWITTLRSIPGNHGTYTVGLAGMRKLARDFIAFMGRSDPTISVTNPIRPVTLTLRVTGDDPNPASPSVVLEHVVTLTPHLRNEP
jgi:hypothetical protein